MVDVLVFTADNTGTTDMVRWYRRPPVRELGEVDEKYVIGTVEILPFPQKKKKKKRKKRKRYGNQTKEMR